MIHRTTIILIGGIICLTYYLGNDSIIKSAWLVGFFIFISNKLSESIDVFFKEPLRILGILINYLVLTVFYFLILTPFSLISRVISKLSTRNKNNVTNFVIRNHEFEKNDLIRTF